MGLDMYIEKIKRDPNDKHNIITRKELCYWRKNWNLMYNLPFKYGDEEYAKDVLLTKDDVEKILDYVIHHRDYFNGFQEVANVCDVLDIYDELKDDGYEVVFNADW